MRLTGATAGALENDGAGHEGEPLARAHGLDVLNDHIEPAGRPADESEHDEPEQEPQTE